MGSFTPPFDSSFSRSTRRAPAERYLYVRHVGHRADIEVCLAVGEVDLYTAPVLQRALRETEQRQVPRVFVDLSQVRFLAVAGVRVLLAAAENARATGRMLGLVAATRRVRRPLELTGALDSLATYECLSDALTAPAVPEQRRPPGR